MKYIGHDFSRTGRARRLSALVSAQSETRTAGGRCSLRPGCRTDPYSRLTCLGPSATRKQSLFDQRQVALQASENFSQHSCLPAALDSLQNHRRSARRVYAGKLAARFVLQITGPTHTSSCSISSPLEETSLSEPATSADSSEQPQILRAANSWSPAPPAELSSSAMPSILETPRQEAEPHGKCRLPILTCILNRNLGLAQSAGGAVHPEAAAARLCTLDFAEFASSISWHYQCQRPQFKLQRKAPNGGSTSGVRKNKTRTANLVSMT